MINRIKNNVNSKIAHFKETPFEGVSYLIPVIMLVISAIYALMTYNEFKDSTTGNGLQFTEGQIEVYLQCVKMEVTCFLAAMICLLKGRFKEFKLLDKFLFFTWWTIPFVLQFNTVAFLIAFTIMTSIVLITIYNVTKIGSSKLLVFVNVAVFLLAPFYLLYLQNQELFSQLFILGIVLIGGFAIFGVGPAVIGSNNRVRNANTETTDNVTSRAQGKYQKKLELHLNTTFWVDRDIINTPCVYYKNNVGAKSQACTVYEFEKGEVAIYNKKQRIMNVPGCKMPER